MKPFSFFIICLFLISGCFNQAKNENESELEADTGINLSNELKKAEIDSDIEFTIDTFVQFGEGKIFGSSNNQGEEDLFLHENNLPQNLNEIAFFVKVFTSANKAEKFVRAIKLYESIKTDTALIKFYRDEAGFIISTIDEGILKSHPDIVYGGDDTPAIAWAWVKDFLPVRTACLSSESSSEAYKFLPDFSEKAKTTRGTLDDQLFNLLNSYYEDYDNTWLTIGYGNAGCDYCGYSTFGNEQNFQLFKEIIAVEKQTKFLDPELSKLVASMVDFGGTAFSSSKADVIEEIDAFLELKDSTRFDISELLDEKGKIANADKGYIFDATFEDFTIN
ncbi:MAG: hypothetical protein P1P88_01400 [Bacteroidales bacterium]|nr:hypothetical protein [Bacteroidales bacterium]